MADAAIEVHTQGQSDLLNKMKTLLDSKKDAMAALRAEVRAYWCGGQEAYHCTQPTIAPHPPPDAAGTGGAACDGAGGGADTAAAGERAREGGGGGCKHDAVGGRGGG